MRRPTFFSVVGLLFLASAAADCQEPQPGKLPVLEAEDLLVLLDASYAKVSVAGKAASEFALSVVDKNGKTVGREQILKLGPSGIGSLCVMAKNKDGITGRNPVITFAFTWNTLPLVQKGVMEIKKNWNFRKGVTFTDGYTTDSFNSPQIAWNLGENDSCDITRIWWSPKNISAVDASGNVEQVGAVVLRKRSPLSAPGTP